MKKYLLLLLINLFSISVFAQTKEVEKNLGKTLEKNKDTSAVFVSEMDLSKMQVTESGTVIIPLFAKNKLKIVSGMDFTNINERISYTKKTRFRAKFLPKDLSQKIKVYTLTEIEGIETVDEYNARLVEEARIAEEKRIEEEKRKAEEAKAKWEKERLENLTKFPV